VSLSAAAATASLQGQARVIDGDTLSVGGVVVRLHGIDAPERDQMCEAAGRNWACGTWARAELVRLTGEARITCRVIDTDRYGRSIGQCLAPAGDLGRDMVAAGAAVAYRHYSHAYVPDEEDARAARRGLWRDWGDGVQMPADWRRQRRAADRATHGDDPVVPDGCTIKGNISASGRLYHRPGQRDYAHTHIDPARGERWFCTVAEAEAAGWRAARR